MTIVLHAPIHAAIWISENYSAMSEPKKRKTEYELADATPEDENYYLGKDGTTKWDKIKRSTKIKARAYNINTHLAGLLTSIIYIDKIQTNFSREKDARYTDKTKMRAFIGLLYVIGTLEEKKLSELWNKSRSKVSASTNRDFKTKRPPTMDEKALYTVWSGDTTKKRFTKLQISEMPHWCAKFGIEKIGRSFEALPIELFLNIGITLEILSILENVLLSMHILKSLCRNPSLTNSLQTKRGDRPRSKEHYLSRGDAIEAAVDSLCGVSWSPLEPAAPGQVQRKNGVHGLFRKARHRKGSPELERYKKVHQVYKREIRRPPEGLLAIRPVESKD
nr:unnamed protein product [Callosobruchus chinensis]